MRSLGGSILESWRRREASGRITKENRIIVILFSFTLRIGPRSLHTGSCKDHLVLGISYTRFIMLS